MAKVKPVKRAVDDHGPFTSVQFRAAFEVIGLFICTLALWSYFAPLNSAIVAPGVVGVETQRKQVQHLEGGIVRNISVREGAKVKQGDILLELTSAENSANAERLQSEFIETMANIARLEAERDRANEINFAKELKSSSAGRSAIDEQRRLFNSRREAQGLREDVIDKRISRHVEEMKGLRKQIASVVEQRRLVEVGIKDSAALFDRKLTTKTRLLDAQRTAAELDERISDLQSKQLQVEQQVSELELKKNEDEAKSRAEISEELRVRQTRLHELVKQKVAADDLLERMQIRAPFDGTIVGLRQISRNTVIAPGQVLMEIVPNGEALVVEARVRPEDIEFVQAGLSAEIVLNTQSRRYRQPLSGTVQGVSADRLVDAVQSRPYYAVRVALAPARHLGSEQTIRAGMSADVFIQTGTRTTLAYLTDPLVRIMTRGMREQ